MRSLSTLSQDAPLSCMLFACAPLASARAIGSSGRLATRTSCPTAGFMRILRTTDVGGRRVTIMLPKRFPPKFDTTLLMRWSLWSTERAARDPFFQARRQQQHLVCLACTPPIPRLYPACAPRVPRLCPGCATFVPRVCPA